MATRRCIVLASRNAGKVREIRAVLGDLPVEIVSLDDWAGPLVEPAEDGWTFSENARLKARHYAQATGQWCLADDSGLAVDALGGEPGLRSARYAIEDCPAGADRATIDAANNTRLLKQLAGVRDARRTARFICHLALAEPQRVLLETCGAVEGRIAHELRGTGGFGYDPLFYVPQLGCTTAELSAQRKNAISHRGKAVRQLKAMLGELLAHQG